MTLAPLDLTPTDRAAMADLCIGALVELDLEDGTGLCDYWIVRLGAQDLWVTTAEAQADGRPSLRIDHRTVVAVRTVHT